LGGEIVMERKILNSNTIESVVETAWKILKGKQTELRDTKNALNSCKISLAEFEKKQKDINEWDWLLRNGVDNPLAIISQNVVYIDEANGLMFEMGNGSLFSSLTEDEMVMSRTKDTFAEKYLPDENYFVGPRCLSDTKFFDSHKFNIVRLAFGESMNKTFNPDFRITRKVI
jgi:hypothetical protein